MPTDRIITPGNDWQLVLAFTMFDCFLFKCFHDAVSCLLTVLPRVDEQPPPPLTSAIEANHLSPGPRCHQSALNSFGNRTVNSWLWKVFPIPVGVSLTRMSSVAFEKYHWPRCHRLALRSFSYQDVTNRLLKSISDQGVPNKSLKRLFSPIFS